MSANWLASNTGIKQYYYQYDGLGSIIALTNESGQVVEKYEYDVFGAPIIRTANDQIVPASLTGNDSFMSKLESMIGHRLRPLPIGRPKKIKGKRK